MDKATNLHWSSASRTHVGMVRKLNEDAYLELANRGLWVVADGMGGHAAGDVASRMIVDALAAMPEQSSLGSYISEVHQQLDVVNRTLADEASRRRERVIGSTVVALIVRNRHGVALWAGDSRAYRYRKGNLTQLTRDHSQVEDLVSQGLITREQAEHHPASNVITRAVGVSAELELDSEMFEVEEGDVYLLCSDGLYNEVTAAEIENSLAVGNSQKSCDMLIDQALSRGARDNVSVIVVCAEDEGQITKTQLNPSAGRRRDADDSDDPTTLK